MESNSSSSSIDEENMTVEQFLDNQLQVILKVARALTFFSL
jgi:hypothetical protein